MNPFHVSLGHSLSLVQFVICRITLIPRYIFISNLSATLLALLKKENLAVLYWFSLPREMRLTLIWRDTLRKTPGVAKRHDSL
jgi:hypothetical protein